MATIKAINVQAHYTTQLIGNHNESLADEPVMAGGQGKGFSPSELLAASLASCTAITLRMYADRKHWNLTKIEVNVSVEKDDANHDTILTRTLHLSGDLTEEQRHRLLDIANLCPIHKMLTNTIRIQTSM